MKPMQTKNYQDFEVEIGQPGANGLYPVRVIHSPSGESVETAWVDVDANHLTMQNLVEQLRQLTISSNDVAQLGTMLANYLLPEGPVRNLYYRNRGAVLDANRQRLRFRLRIIPPELQRLPWEYLFENANDYLALDERISVVRYLTESAAPALLMQQTPVPMLLVVINYANSLPLDIIHDVRNTVNALRPLMEQGKVTLDILFSGAVNERRKLARLLARKRGVRLLAQPATLEALQASLRNNYHILHYIGHGIFDPTLGGLLPLGDAADEARLIDGRTLGQLMRGHTVGLVVLNACETADEATSRSFMGLATNLIRAEIPAVIAIQFPISDVSSVAFSHQFYAALADGLPIDAAMTQGRKAIFQQLEPFKWEWGKPVLFLRTTDGRLWQTQEVEQENAPANLPANTDQTSPALNPGNNAPGGIIIAPGAEVKAKNIVVGTNIEVKHSRIVDS